MAIELIDTLWNVNSSKLITYFFASFELIDTLWNVNTFSTWRCKDGNRINRYIMECKCDRIVKRFYAKFEN